MEMPSVQNVLNDSQRGVRYEVYAYRALTIEELVFAVRSFLAQAKRKPKRGTCVEIHTVIGARD
jgi:hypothetical protein